MAKSTVDFSPLRKHRDFRNLWLSGLVSNLGSMITYVAVPFQIKEMTHSYLAVGISGAVELVPLIVFGLYGGVLADAVDRKKILWATEALSLLLTAILLANSLLGRPNLILIYVVTGLFAAVNGVQKPSVDVFSFLVSLIFLAKVGSVPALAQAEKPSLAGLLAGVRYAFTRQDLLGTYLIDLAAMFLAMPTGLIPFWAD